MLQWRPVKGEDIPIPNTNEIMVLFSFFQHGFGLPTCEFIRGLLHYYQIEPVHLNNNSILQITIFVHLCEAYLDSKVINLLTELRARELCLEWTTIANNDLKSQST
jgi:hypothetical protein